MPKTSFDAKFADKDKPVILYHIISPDNPKQQGENFLEFVRLVNEQPMGDIAKVIIVDTSYLRRHYDFRYSDSKNQKFLFEWREANKQFIRQIQIPYEVISWLELINRDIYKDFHEKIKKTFDDGTDEKFRKIVCDIASQFTHKGTTKQSVSYLLEECTATALLEGYETYPGKLNDAIQHIRKQYGIGPKFAPYTLGSLATQPKEKEKEISASRTSPTEKKTSPRGLISSSSSAFFNGGDEEIVQDFPERLSLLEQNHAWKVVCDIQFVMESKERAIKTVLTNISEAKEYYEERKDKLSHPIVFKDERQFAEYKVSYRIQINDSSVLMNTNPFAILIGAVELKSGIKYIGQPKQLESQHHEEQSSQQIPSQQLAIK